MVDGLSRIVARNPSRMTYHGTNTYLLAEEGGFLVLDPGPADDPAHVAEVIRATKGRITRYVVTHGHHDHVGALPELKSRVPAPVHSFEKRLNLDQPRPDVPMRDGDRVGDLIAVHTPGHAPDHLCFQWHDGMIFTGDHVMGWSSSVVSPPLGSMADYIASLDRLLARYDRLYLPGHGPTLASPHGYVRELRNRRVAREREILEALQREQVTVAELSRRLYAKTDPILQSAAERNVLSHLEKLQAEGSVREEDGFWYPSHRPG